MTRLTPLEIQKHEFSRKWKGFDPVEVESFLAMIAEEMEELARANSELETRVRALEEENARAPRARADPEGDARRRAARLRGHPRRGAEASGADRPAGPGFRRAADPQRPPALRRDREGDPRAQDPADQLPPAAPEHDRALPAGARFRPRGGREGPADGVSDRGRREREG